MHSQYFYSFNDTETYSKMFKININPFFSNATFLYPLKTSKPRGWKKGTSGTNGLIYPHNPRLQYCTDIFFAAKEEG